MFLTIDRILTSIFSYIFIQETSLLCTGDMEYLRAILHRTTAASALHCFVFRSTFFQTNGTFFFVTCRRNFRKNNRFHRLIISKGNFRNIKCADNMSPSTIRCSFHCTFTQRTQSTYLKTINTFFIINFSNESYRLIFSRFTSSTIPITIRNRYNSITCY